MATAGAENEQKQAPANARLRIASPLARRLIKSVRTRTHIHTLNTHTQAHTQHTHTHTYSHTDTGAHSTPTHAYTKANAHTHTQPNTFDGATNTRHTKQNRTQGHKRYRESEPRARKQERVGREGLFGCACAHTANSKTDQHKTKAEHKDTKHESKPRPQCQDRLDRGRLLS